MLQLVMQYKHDQLFMCLYYNIFTSHGTDHVVVQKDGCNLNSQQYFIAFTLQSPTPNKIKPQTSK